jgi:hypothetical protein
MYKLNQTVSVKRWQVFLMIGLSGFAISGIFARIAAGWGF